MLKPSFALPILPGLLLASLLHAQPATAGSDYALHQGTLRLTYDPMTIGNGESLGLLGVHALIRQGQYGYLGVSGFGAVAGGRGGFLTLGYTAGVSIPIEGQLYADLSLFLGGGGGGSAPQGGGLMVREQAGLGYTTSYYQVGTGISRVYFPNGEIDSTQPYLSLQIPFTAIFASGWETGELSPESFSQPLYDQDSSIALSYKAYHGASLFNSAVQPSSTISTIGVDWRHYLPTGFFYSLSAYGAYRGGADGYAEVMAGGGYQWHLTPATRLGIAMSLGSGGGGNVATGGGLLSAFTINLDQDLTHRVFVSLQGGHAGSIGGKFSGNVAGIALGIRHTSPTTTLWEDSEPAGLPYMPSHYRLRLMNQHYFPGTALPRNEPAVTKTVDLTGLQLDMQMGNYFYLTGQAMEAWRGGAGGYATGMVGGGLTLPLSSRVALNGELLAGAGGGGGLNVGGGILLGATVSANVHLADSLDLEMGTGRIRAYSGGLDARQITLAIAYRFTNPER